MAFEAHRTIRLSDTDAAGRVFVANYIRLAHDAYEEWLSIGGVELAESLAGRAPILPIVHIEADFSQPVQVGDILRIQILAHQSGDSSFETNYTFIRGADETVAEVRMKHVSVDVKTGKSTPLPESLLTLF